MLVSKIDLSRVRLDYLCRKGHVTFSRYFSAGRMSQVVKTLLSHGVGVPEFTIESLEDGRMKEFLQVHVVKKD